MKAVWFLDDENIKHFTVVRNSAELIFLKERFDFVGTIEDFMIKV